MKNTNQLQKKKAKFWSLLITDQSGSAVLEVVVVIAVVLAIALLFNTQLQAYAQRLFSHVFNDNSVFEILG